MSCSMSSVSDIKLIRTDFFFFFLIKVYFHIVTKATEEIKVTLIYNHSSITEARGN